MIKKGDKYIHSNGNKYEVILIANSDSDREEYPETVVYVGSNGKVWAKTKENFLSKMTKDTVND